MNVSVIIIILFVAVVISAKNYVLCFCLYLFICQHDNSKKLIDKF